MSLSGSLFDCVSSTFSSIFGFMLNVSTILENAIGDISDREVVTTIRRYLTEPRLEYRNWGYKDGTQYPCWIIAVDRESKTVLAYCEHGFGPSSPWGILSDSSEAGEMGMDCCWFTRLEDAIRQSVMWKGNNPPGYEVH
jgi:hypothetical protein